MNSITTHYQALSNTFKLPSMQLGTIEAATQHFLFTEVDTLSDYIASNQPAQGWICYQSQIRQFDDGNLPPTNTQTGYILNAEFRLDQQSSLHIRQIDTGWLATVLEEKEGGDLILPSHYLQMNKPDEKHNNPEKYLYYRTVWKQDKHNGYQPALYRFIGFHKEA